MPAHIRAVLRTRPVHSIAQDPSPAAHRSRLESRRPSCRPRREAPPIVGSPGHTDRNRHERSAARHRASRRDREPWARCPSVAVRLPRALGQPRGLACRQPEWQWDVYTWDKRRFFPPLSGVPKMPVGSFRSVRQFSWYALDDKLIRRLAAEGCFGLHVSQYLATTHGDRRPISMAMCERTNGGARPAKEGSL